MCGGRSPDGRVGGRGSRFFSAADKLTARRARARREELDVARLDGEALRVVLHCLHEVPICDRLLRPLHMRAHGAACLRLLPPALLACPLGLCEDLGLVFIAVIFVGHVRPREHESG